MNFKTFMERNYWGTSGAGAVIHCSKTNRVLALLRSRAVYEGGTWTIVAGGKIDPIDASPKAAAQREVEEELEYHGTINSISLINTFQDEDFQYSTFKFSVPEEFTPKLGWETDDFLWWDGEKDIPGKWHFGAKDVLKNARHKIFN